MNLKISSLPIAVKQYFQKILDDIRAAKPLSPNFAFNTIIIIVSFMIGLHLIYVYGQHPVIMPEEKFLHQIFNKKPYSPIYQKLSQNQYVFINAGSEDHNKQALAQLFNYYGATNRIGIIYKDYTQSTISNIPWIFRTYIESTICSADLTPKLYVFRISKEVPKLVKQIKVSQPNSRIALMSPFPFSQESKKQKFVNAGMFPNFDLKSILKKQAKIPQKLLSKFQQYYKIRTRQVFVDIDSRWRSLQQSYLKDYYSPYESLSQSTQKILEELCIDNKLARGSKLTNRNKKQLQKFGISLQRGGAKWRHQKYMLNFILQTEKNECDIVFIDTKSKYIIQKIGNYLSAEEIARRHKQRELQELREEKMLADQNNRQDNQQVKNKNKKFNSKKTKKIGTKTEKKNKNSKKDQEKLPKITQNSKKAKKMSKQDKNKVINFSLDKGEKKIKQKKGKNSNKDKKENNIKLK